MLAKFSDDPDFFVLQIGANDGVENDLIHGALIKNRWAALLIEPQPEFVERLRETYVSRQSISYMCCAVAEHNGTIDLYRIPPELIFQGKVKPWIGGCASLYLDRGPFSKGDAKWNELLNVALTAIPVKCLTLPDLINQNNISRIDMLVIDTEGGDWMVLRQLDMTKFLPRIIIYEFSHLSNDERLESVTHLNRNGYALYINKTRSDVLAVKQ